MAGYTRQDTANNIANGNVIDADDFDSEYNAIESAFNNTSGHTHDGTAGEGAPITKVGPAQDLIVSGVAVMPKSTNTLDLGSAVVQYKDAFFDGTVNTDTLSVDENATVSGTLGVTGVTTLSNNLNVTGAAGIDGNFDINTNKFTVNATSGNTTVGGTLSVTGQITGNVTGNLTGNVAGNVTGNVTGDVTGDVTGNADTATAWQTSRTLSLTGDVTGTVSGVDGTGNISIATTIQPNSVALGTDTTGNYVASLVAGTGVTLTNNTGEGATPTVAIGQAVGTTSNVTFNDVVVSGNLTVSGSTTTVNTETINLADNQIVLNSNYTGSSPTENGGIEIERGTLANKTLVWDETADKWTVGSESFVAGVFEGNLTGDVTGNASTATTLETSRTIELDGDVTGSASFDGSSDINITATVADYSHNHTIANIDGLQAAISAAFPSGGIIMWSGTIAAIPSGWYLCDGNNGTPNLKDRFIVGSTSDSGQTHDIGDTGGDNNRTLTAANIPAHTHSFSGTTSTNGDHYHANGVVYDVSAEAYYGTVSSSTRTRSNSSANETKSGMPRTSTDGDHTHTISGTTGSTGSGSSFDNRPAYYALAFIMKA